MKLSCKVPTILQTRSCVPQVTYIPHISSPAACLPNPLPSSPTSNPSTFTRTLLPCRFITSQAIPPASTISKPSQPPQRHYHNQHDAVANDDGETALLKLQDLLAKPTWSVHSLVAQPTGEGDDADADAARQGQSRLGRTSQEEHTTSSNGSSMGGVTHTHEQIERISSDWRTVRRLQRLTALWQGHDEQSQADKASSATNGADDPGETMQTMQSTLATQLHFLADVQAVDTSGIAPLQSIRDETRAAEAEHTVGLAQLKRDVLDMEQVVGHMRRPRRQRGLRGATAGGGGGSEEVGLDWDPLAAAQKKAGRYFVVESGGLKGSD